MKRFKLLAGKHQDPETGDFLLPGAIITSDRDLDKVFKNKFQVLDGKPEPEKPPTEKGKTTKRRRRKTPKTPKLSPVERKRGQWDVVDEDGNTINDSPLDKATANRMASL